MWITVYVGTMPDVGQTSTGTGCANWAGNICNPPWTVSNIQVKNCGAFYTYLLPPTPCVVAYCASEYNSAHTVLSFKWLCWVDFWDWYAWFLRMYSTTQSVTKVLSHAKAKTIECLLNNYTIIGFGQRKSLSMSPRTLSVALLSVNIVGPNCSN